jgi:hypothetical protein
VVRAEPELFAAVPLVELESEGELEPDDELPEPDEALEPGLEAVPADATEFAVPELSPGSSPTASCVKTPIQTAANRARVSPTTRRRALATRRRRSSRLAAASCLGSIEEFISIRVAGQLKRQLNVP